jgi:hypothetical protein
MHDGNERAIACGRGCPRQTCHLAHSSSPNACAENRGQSRANLRPNRPWRSAGRSAHLVPVWSSSPAWAPATRRLSSWRRQMWRDAIRCIGNKPAPAMSGRQTAGSACGLHGRQQSIRSFEIGCVGVWRGSTAYAATSHQRGRARGGKSRAIERGKGMQNNDTDDKRSIEGPIRFVSASLGLSEDRFVEAATRTLDRRAKARALITRGLANNAASPSDVQELFAHA